MITVKFKNAHGIEKHKVSKFPCRIGRAEDNEITLDDESVSSHHAVIEYVGEELVYKDLGSTNGSRIGTRIIQSFALNGSIEIVLGVLPLNIKTSHGVVESTVRVDPASLKSNKLNWENPYVKTGTVLSVSVLVYFFCARFMDPSFKASTFASSQIGLFFLYGIVAAGLAGWSKMHTGKYQVLTILPVVIVCSVLFRLHIAMSDFLTFNVNSPAFSLAWAPGIPLLIFFFFTYVMSKILFPETLKSKRLVIAALIVVLTGAGFGVPALLAEDRFDLVKMSFDVSYPLKAFTADKYGYDRIEERIEKLNKKNEKQRLELVEKASAN
ncbi:FHA domain protein [compost metagenome]